MALRPFRLFAVVVAVLSSGLTLRAQSTRVQDLGVGKLLLASRDSKDPVFAETVILLVHYDHAGTVGLAINRRTDIAISRALPEFRGAKGHGDAVYIGGPVEVQNVLALLRANVMPEGAAHVSGKLYLVSSKSLLEKTLSERTESSEFRVYLGYCGWSPGQLENETRHGFWHVFSGDADFVFDPKPGTLWSRLIARVGQRIAQDRVPLFAEARSLRY